MVLPVVGSEKRGGRYPGVPCHARNRPGRRASRVDQRGAQRGEETSPIRDPSEGPSCLHTDFGYRTVSRCFVLTGVEQRVTTGERAPTDRSTATVVRIGSRVEKRRAASMDSVAGCPLRDRFNANQVPPPSALSDANGGMDAVVSPRTPREVSMRCHVSRRRRRSSTEPRRYRGPLSRPSLRSCSARAPVRSASPRLREPAARR